MAPHEFLICLFARSSMINFTLFKQKRQKTSVGTGECVFEIPRFHLREFESERPKGDSTKQSPNYHLLDLDKVGQMAKWQFGDKTVVKLPFGHSTNFSDS